MHRPVGGGTVRAARVVLEVHLALDGELEVGSLHVQVVEIEVPVHAERRGLARLFLGLHVSRLASRWMRTLPGMDEEHVGVFLQRRQLLVR